MSNSPDKNRDNPIFSTTDEVAGTADETLLAGGVVTRTDFGEILVKAKTVQPDPLEKEPHCVDLVSRLKDIKTIRQLAAAAKVSQASELVPRSLGQFELLESLGGGGMGQVFRARHAKLGKIQAVKLLHARRLQDVEAVARFQREMAAIGQLQHPNIVAAHHADEHDGVPYLVMDFVDGESLSSLTRRFRDRGDQMPVDVACELVRQAAVGLQYAHEQGVVHRDVKPANIMLDKFGTVRVLDLGLARSSQPDSLVEPSEDLTTEHQILGTPDYMAPEQVRDSKSVDGLCDVYALGATLYFLLTGQPVFPAEKSSTTMDRVLRILSEPVPDVRDIRPDVPDRLAEVICKTLCKEPGERLQSAGELAKSIEEWAADAARLKSIMLVDDNQLTDVIRRPEQRLITRSGIPRTSGKRWMMLGGGFLLPMILLAGLIYKLKLPDGGELVVELSDPAAKLNIVAIQGDRQQPLEFEQQGDKTFLLTKGAWELHLSGVDADRFELSQESVEIFAGTRQIVSVTVRPPEVDIPSKLASEPAPEDVLRMADSTANSKLDWTPKDASPELSGIVLQPAKLSPHFEVGTHYLRRPAGIHDQWSGGRHHFDVDPQEKSWAYSTGKEILIRDLNSGQVQVIVVGNNSVNWENVVFSPDGSMFATIDATNGSRGIEIRERTGRLLSKWDHEKTLTSQSSCQVKWMPNGTNLLVWNMYSACVFDLNGKRIFETTFKDKEFVPAVNWADQTSQSYAPASWTADIHPNGEQVCFLLGVGRVLCWHPSDQKLINFADAPNTADNFTGLKWSPLGDRLLVWCASSDDALANVTSIYSASGELMYSQPREGWQLADWSPDGRAIITSNGQILDNTGQVTKRLEIGTLSGEAEDHALPIPYWQSTSEIVFVYGDEERVDRSGIVRRFTPSGGEITTPHTPQPLGIEGCSFTSSGTISSVHSAGHYQTQIFEWQPQNGQGRQVSKSPINTVVGASYPSWSRTDGRIVMGGPNQQVIFDQSTATTELRTFEYPKVGRHSAVFSPDGEFLCFANDVDDKMIVEDRQGKVVHQFDGGGYGSHPQFSNDGRWLLWPVHQDGHQWMNLVDLSTDAPQPQQISLTKKMGGYASFSPDSRFLTVVDRVEQPERTDILTIRNLDTGETILKPITWSRAGTLTPEWSPDGKYVYAGQLFKVMDGGQLEQVADMLDNKFIQFAAFVGEGRLLIGGGEQTLDGQFRIDIRQLDGTLNNSTTISSGIQVPPVMIGSSVRRSKDNVLVSLRRSNDNVAHAIAVLDVESAEVQWTGLAFDDGQTVTLGPGGNVIHGPRDIDRYCIRSIRYAGGRTVPVTQGELQLRLAATAAQQAMHWATDHRGRMKSAGGDPLPASGVEAVPQPELPDSGMLISLDLSGTKEMAGLELTHLSQMPALAELNLSNCTLKEFPEIDGLQKLTFLSLARTPVTNVSGIAGHTSLTDLDLSGTAINASVGAVLRELTALRSLNLSNTAIDRFTILDLEGLSQLRRLDLRGTELTHADVEPLAAKLPNCQIMFE